MEEYNEACDRWEAFLSKVDPQPTPEELAEEYQRNYKALEAGLNKTFKFPY